MQKLYIQMVKDILTIITKKSIDINNLCNRIGITKKTMLEYLNFEKTDFSMYLLMLDLLKSGQNE